MIHYYFLLIISVLLSLTSYSQIKNFEGELVITYTTGALKNMYNVKISGYNIKIDFYTSNSKTQRSLLINLNTNEIFELNNFKENFKLINPKSFEYQSLPKYSLKEDVDDFKKIQTYQCEKWTLSEIKKEDKTTLRIAKDDKFKYLKRTFKYLNISDPLFKFIDLFAKSENIIPFSVTKQNKNGKTVSSIIINSLSEKKIPAEEFKIPSHFKSW